MRTLKHFLLALQFFTRIPVTGRLAQWVGYSPEMLRQSAGHMPGVGALVGGLCAATLSGALALLPAVPASAWAAAALSTALGLLLTGAFHEDGLADTADGLGGAYTAERALAIMKDSRVGAFGALTLAVALLIKLSLLAVLVQAQAAWAVLGLWLGHVVSRWPPLWVIAALHHVGERDGSKSKPLADRIGPAALATGTAWLALALWVAHTLGLPLQAMAVAVGLAVLAAAVMAWRLQRRLGGFTGDGLGATQQVAELGFYLGLALAWRPA